MKKIFILSFIIFSLLLAYGCSKGDKKDKGSVELIKNQTMAELNSSMRKESISPNATTFFNQTNLTNGTIFFPNQTIIYNSTTLPNATNNSI